MSPEGTIGMESFGMFAVSCLMILRIWIQRGRRDSTSSKVYEVCIWSAFACYLYITIVDVGSSVKQMHLKLGSEAPPMELNKAMLTVTFQKVFFLLVLGGIGRV